MSKITVQLFALLWSLSLFTSCGSSGDSGGDSNGAGVGTPTLSDKSPMEPTADDDDPGSEEGGVQRGYEEYVGLDFSSESPEVDLNQDLSNKSLEELRILRNTLPARQGYLFMKSDMRAYFEETPWYKKVMEARWYGECEESGLEPMAPISYSAEEQAFLNKVQAEEAKRKAQNYLTSGNRKVANYANVVNRWMFEDFADDLGKKLSETGFAIVPNKNVQLFHVYEENDYSQTQNFVTTDLFLQLFHMHFSFLLRSLEEEQFVPILKEMLTALSKEANLYANSATDPALKNAAEYATAYYSIPLSILTDKDAPVSGAYQAAYQTEMKNIRGQEARQSALLAAFEKVEFPYSLFKPRGHYTRTETLKKYFMAMQWLQLAPYCQKEEKDFQKALFSAWLMNNKKSAKGTPLVDLYNRVLEPTTFLVGEPDNISLMDVCEAFKKEKISDPAQLFQGGTTDRITALLNEVAKQRNRIKPKIELTCADKINFMPARYLADNEILQEMVDVKSGAPSPRPFPKGLDVMAAFGSKAAEDMLVDFHKEESVWSEFRPSLDKMKAKFQNFKNWDKSVYNKWMEGLLTMLKPDPSYPYFMQLPEWNRKNLNTALASWAELKHDAILYAEQPFAAECGSGGECDPPPQPYTVGYVEPNVRFWKKAQDLIDLTDAVLRRNGLLSSDLKYKSSELKELAEFLEGVSRKELKGEKLTESEYRSIEIIGSSVEHLTLSIMETDDWSSVQGPDKEVAVVADIYTNNVDPEKAGILHVAVGNVNDLYVVVEIEGLLYITRGGTFSYHEFTQTPDKRLTDEEWQDLLKAGKAPSPPAWMKKITVPLKKMPEVQTISYSSGC